MGVAAAFAAAFLLVAFSPGYAQPPDGAALVAAKCAACHNGSADARAPALDALRGRSPDAIVDALTGGSMRYQGLSLSGAERRAIAEYLAGRKMRGDTLGARVGRCEPTPPLADPWAGALWNGWGPTVENTHFQPAAEAGLAAADVPRLTLKWAFGFPDTTSAWAQPTVAGGRVFVGGQNGTVYALDAKTGCIAWTFTAKGGVRTAVSIGPRRGSGVQATYAAYFADQKGYVYAVGASSGRLLWSRKIDDHPLVRLTGSPTLHNGRLYVPTSSYEEVGRPPGYPCCTFRGSLVALDARTGRVVWKAYPIAQPPKLMAKTADGRELWGPSGGAIWAAPTIDAKRGAVYVGVGNTYSGPAQPATDAVVAFDLKTGKRRWARQMTANDVYGCRAGDANCGDRSGPDFDFGASPTLARLPDGRDLIVIGQKSGIAYALDPDGRGKIVWQYRAGKGSALGGIEWGAAVDQDQAYFPVADIYNPTPGGLHAVTLATGERVWYTPPPPPKCGAMTRGCSGAQSAAITAIPGIVFSPSMDGAVRAYDTRTGAVVWEFDTNREFDTINGVAAKGGSMNGPAPTVAGGTLYVNSGYGAFGSRPGNVLLAFGVE